MTAIVPEWRALAERRGNAFLTPDWFLAWLRHFGQSWKPHVAVVVPLVGSFEGCSRCVSSKSDGRGELRVARR